MFYKQTREIPVIEETDICVVGGSATGVFAAIRAARLGANTVIVEKQNCFGGTATAGMVCVWHSLLDINFETQIISGLTEEILERLKRRKALYIREIMDGQPRILNIATYTFNSEELKIELDEMILENGVKPYLHTMYTAPLIIDGNLEGVIIENKSGCGIIKAKVFIDATGDGDICHSMGLESLSVPDKQPATTCAKVIGYNKVTNASKLILKHKNEYNIKDIGWETFIPGAPEVNLLAKSNIYMDCSNAEELTKAEIEGRRQTRAMLDIINKYSEEAENVTLLALSSHIGIRETRQIRCLYQLTEDDILYGVNFNDSIANGSYPIDIHHTDKPGATYRYIDGIEEYEQYGLSLVSRRWNDKQKEGKTFWQIPFRSMIPAQTTNVIVCGRAIDVDKGAFGAIRVMVILNQTGEAAGVAAYEALTTGSAVKDIDFRILRRRLLAGGSIVL